MGTNTWTHQREPTSKNHSRQLCEDTACSQEDLSIVIYYRGKWHNIVKGILAINMTCFFSYFSLMLHLSVSVSLSLPLSIYIYQVHTISFQTFFVWTLLLIVHTWNSSPLRSNLLRLQCTCTVPTTSRRPHGSPLVWACQWPSSEPLSFSQLSHNDSFWA